MKDDLIERLESAASFCPWRAGQPAPLLREAAAELARLRDQAREAGWEPIETAPRDGTPIIVWGPDIERGQPFHARSCWWSDPWESWVVRETATSATFLKAALLTHWQPLPAPPAQEPKDEG